MLHKKGSKRRDSPVTFVHIMDILLQRLISINVSEMLSYNSLDELIY